jgi:hypothetical protein
MDHLPRKAPCRRWLRCFSFGNNLRAKLAASVVDGDKIMLLAVELITMLVLGFVLGRIWQIRQELLLAEHVVKRRLPDENEIESQGSERSQTTGRNSSMPSDRQTESLPVAPVSARLLRGSPMASRGRFQTLHQSLHPVSG